MPPFMQSVKASLNTAKAKTSGLRQTDIAAAGSERCVARCCDPAGRLCRRGWWKSNVPAGRCTS